jgi:hypothetical protein
MHKIISAALLFSCTDALNVKKSGVKLRSGLSAEPTITETCLYSKERVGTEEA